MTIDEYADIYRAFADEQIMRIFKTILHGGRQEALRLAQGNLRLILDDTIRAAAQTPQNVAVTTVLDLQENFSANNTFLWTVPYIEHKSSTYYRVLAPGMFDIDGDTGFINDDRTNPDGPDKFSVGFFVKSIRAVYGWDEYNNPPPRFATYQEAAAFVVSALIINGAANPVEG